MALSSNKAGLAGSRRRRRILKGVQVPFLRSFMLLLVVWFFNDTPSVISAFTPRRSCTAWHRSSYSLPRPLLSRNEFVLQKIQVKVDNEAPSRVEDLPSTVPFRSSSYIRSFLWTYGPYGASAVLVWRGIWDLQDIYLFPDDLITSSLLSAAIGITFGTVAFFAQHVLNDTVKTVLVAVASISYWRGVWILWDELVWPQDPTLQSVAGLVVGSAVLLAAKSFRLGVASPPILHQNDQIYLLEDPFLGPAHAAFDVAHQEEEVLHSVDGVRD
jgi:hypothetical protein